MPNLSWHHNSEFALLWGVWRTMLLVWLVLTLSISPLFLLRVERVILTVTALSSPWRRRAIRFGCRGLKEISSSGRGKRLVLPFSVEISEESSTDGQPAEPCGTTRDLCQVWGYRLICLFVRGAPVFLDHRDPTSTWGPVTASNERVDYRLVPATEKARSPLSFHWAQDQKWVVRGPEGPGVKVLKGMGLWELKVRDTDDSGSSHQGGSLLR